MSVCCPVFVRTLRLHTNTVHGLVTESSVPSSVYVHIDTRFVRAWFIVAPVTKAHVPSINISEIPLSLKAKIDQIALSVVTTYFSENYENCENVNHSFLYKKNHVSSMPV